MRKTYTPCSGWADCDRGQRCVTAYLSPTAILDTLRAISRATPASSHLVFDYLDVDVFTADKSSARVRQLLRCLQHLGEPMRSGVDPNTLRQNLSAIGLQLIEDLGPEALQQRYFVGRADGLRAREHGHVAWVRSQTTRQGAVAPQPHAVSGAAPQTKGEAAAERTPGS